MIARQVIMRGQEAGRPTIVPMEGELIATLDTQQVYLGDGSTPGGNPLHPLNLVNRRVADHSSVTSVGSLAWWINRAAGAGVTLYLDEGTYPVNQNLTVPANICLKFDNGAMLSVASGKTLTINGGIEAGLWQIFAGAGAFAGSPKVPAAYPEWFGAKGDGVTDDSGALTSVIAFAGNSGVGKVYLRNVVYAITSGISVVFSNPSVVLSVFGNNATLKYIGGVATASMLKVTSLSPKVLSVSDVVIKCEGHASSGIRLVNSASERCGVIDVSGCIVTDAYQALSISDNACGIYIEGAAKCCVSGCVVSNVSRALNSVTSGRECKGIYTRGCATVGVLDNIVSNIKQPVVGDTSSHVDAYNADGIACFSTLTSSGYAEEFVTISGNVVQDCEGRFVKLQTNGRCSVFNNYFKLVSDTLSLIKEWCGVASQVAVADIYNNKFELTAKRSAGSGASAALFVPGVISGATLAASGVYKLNSQRFFNNEVFVKMDGTTGFPYFTILSFPNADSVYYRKCLIDISNNTIQCNQRIRDSRTAVAFSFFMFVSGAATPSSSVSLSGDEYILKVKNNIVDCYYVWSAEQRLEKGAEETDDAWYARIETNRNLIDLSSAVRLELVNNSFTPERSGGISALNVSTNKVTLFTSNVMMYGNTNGAGSPLWWRYPFNLASVETGSNFMSGDFRLSGVPSAYPLSYGTYKTVEKLDSGTLVRITSDDGSMFFGPMATGLPWRKVATLDSWYTP